MAISPLKKQKQLAKKKAKRKAIVAAKQIANSLSNLFSPALKNAPLHQCLANTRMFEEGIGTVLIARKLPNGDISAGFFMLDVFCLGVKSATFKGFSPAEYQQVLRNITQHEILEPVLPACARKLVEDCAAYARDLGFSPDPDYKQAKNVFGDIDPTACPQTFVFGKDGKPFFISGPFDTPEKSRKIINQLTKKCGADGFRYLLGLKPWAEEE
jgi:hypothetical protein